MGLDPTLLAPKAVVARDRAHGAAADDDPSAELAEDGSLRIEPVDLERDREGGVGVGVGVEAKAPVAKGLDDLEAEGSEAHVHAVVAQFLVGAHGRVLAADVHNGEGLGGAEIRIEGEPDHDEQLAHLVLTREPDSLVSLRVRRPHHAHGVRRIVARGTGRGR